MAVNIPEEITIQEFQQIANCLNQILGDVGASQVSLRLNESRRDGEPATDCEDPYFHFSYFVGSVQDAATKDERIKSRIVDPGLFRFGDNVTSKEIREAVGKAVAVPQGDLFANRGWQPQPGGYDVSIKMKGMGSKGMGREAGLKLQKYIGVKVNGRCVGALGVSFRALPQDISAAENQIKHWACGDSSLVGYLRDTFNLWGPSWGSP